MEGPHDAEAMERSALKREKTLYRRNGREPKESSVKSHTKELNVRGVLVRVSWG